MLDVEHVSCKTVTFLRVFTYIYFLYLQRFKRFSLRRQHYAQY